MIKAIGKLVERLAFLGLITMVSMAFAIPFYAIIAGV